MRSRISTITGRFGAGLPFTLYGGAQAGSACRGGTLNYGQIGYLRGPEGDAAILASKLWTDRSRRNLLFSISGNVLVIFLLVSFLPGSEHTGWYIADWIVLALSVANVIAMCVALRRRRRQD